MSTQSRPQPISDREDSDTLRIIKAHLESGPTDVTTRTCALDPKTLAFLDGQHGTLPPRHLLTPSATVRYRRGAALIAFSGIVATGGIAAVASLSFPWGLIIAGLVVAAVLAVVMRFGETT